MTDAPPRPLGANPRADYFATNHDRLMMWKWLHYFDVYHRHFAPFRGRAVTVVEFGVYQGGSLQMWRDYFGPRARIVGVDVDQRCAGLDLDAEVLIGDQADPEFHRQLAAQVGPMDVVIDDGGHGMDQQLVTFRETWPHIRDGGVFLVEDLCTSYWARFEGGHCRPGTFIEYAKTLIDSIHAWHSEDPVGLPVDDYTRTVGGMHVYDSIVVLDKAAVPQPSHQRIGRATIDFNHVSGGSVEQAGTQ